MSVFYGRFLSNSTCSLLSSSQYAYISTKDIRHTWAESCAKAASWLMITAAGAITLNRVDSDGFATWVHVDHGAKIWLICCGPIDATADIFNNQRPWIPDPWDPHLNDFEYLSTHYVWRAVYLPAGSTLYVFVLLSSADTDCSAVLCNHTPCTS